MLPLLFLAVALDQAGEMLPNGDTSCKVIETLPATLRDLVRPLEELRQFELRRCAAGNVQVLAYQGGEKRTALAFETGDPYPSLLALETSVLIPSMIKFWSRCRPCPITTWTDLPGRPRRFTPSASNGLQRNGRSRLPSATPPGR